MYLNLLRWKILAYFAFSIQMERCFISQVILPYLTLFKADGAFLVEVDRLLRPGGYFVLTSRSSKPQGGLVGGKNHVIFTFIEEYSPKICWSMLGQQDDTFIWQKTSDVNCYASR